MSSSKKRPKMAPMMPLSSPVVRRSLVAASLGMGACSSGSGPMPPQVVPPAPPPMVEQRYEDEEQYAMPPADAGLPLTAPMPDAAPTEIRAVEDSVEDAERGHDVPPQVAPPQEGPPPPMIPDDHRSPPPMVPPRPDPPMIPPRPKR